MGSHICANLIADNREETPFTVMDFDKVESRNLQGTQYYIPEVKDSYKTEALQYLMYKNFKKEITTINEKLTVVNTNLLFNYGLVIDTCDNFEARSAITEAQTTIPRVHMGFGKYSWSILWNDGYEPPKNDESWDVCDLPGMASFVRMVASVGSLVVQDFLKAGEKKEFVGGRLSIREVK